MKYLTLLPLLFFSDVYAEPLGNLTQVGQTQMHWLFWKLYDIRLLSRDGRYRDGQYPLALEITYARSIENSQLVMSTVSEWQRMDISWKTDWQQQLQEIWPSVKPGDSLILLVRDDSVSEFYLNREPIGEIRDAEFAQAFLSIWLSAKTREPELRKQLIGDPDA